MNKTLTFFIALMTFLSMQAQPDYFTPYQQTKLLLVALQQTNRRNHPALDRSC